MLTGGTTPAGLARVVTGTYKLDSGPHTGDGIGDQTVTMPGVHTAQLDLEPIGMDKTELLKFFPSTGAADLTDLTPMLLLTDTGHLYKLSYGTPGAASISASTPDGMNSWLSTKLTCMFGKVEAGTGTPIYLTTHGHRRRDASVTMDTAAAGITSWEISNGLGLEPDANFDARSVGDEDALPDGWLAREMNPTFACTFKNPLALTDRIATGAYVPHDFVISLANGTAAEDVAFTLTDWIAPEDAQELQAQGIRHFKYDWKRGSGTISGRLTAA